MGQSLQLTAADGVRLSVYRADPAGTPVGAVVVVQEIFGVNSHIRSVCDRYAQHGYVAIAPALFDRMEPNVDLGYSEQDIAKGIGFMQKASIDHALRDVAAARDAVKSSGRVGILGYCWGGYVTWMAAARLDGFACAIPYYGGGILDAGNERPKCPVLAHFGRKDMHIPVAGVEKFAAQHPEVQVFIYEADHGFNCDQRGSYDAPSARLAEERTLAFLQQHVGSTRR